LGEVLKRTKEARVIDLQSNNITSAGVFHLCEGLKANASVVELNLEHNHIDDAGAAALLDLLRVNSTLVALLLGHNNVSPDNLDRLMFTVSLNTQPRVLKEVIPRLKDDDPEVTEVELSGQPGVNLQLLKSVLMANTKLQRLVCTNCGVGDVGCGIFAEMFKGMKGVHQLDLTGNSITLHGAKSLCDGLKANKSISTLVMQGNKLSDDASRLFVDLLRSNDALTCIDLSDNAVSQAACEALQHKLDLNKQPLELKRAYYAVQVNDPTFRVAEFPWIPNMSLGAHFLAPVLRTNTVLALLNLSNARIGDSGAHAMAGVLKVNKTLMRLELANNDITSDGGSGIAAALALNNTLAELNLANNAICDRAGAEFATVLLTNGAITFLNLELNDIPAKMMNEIDGLVVVNQQPKGLKAILPAIEADSDRVTLVDFSQFDGQKYHNDASARVLCRALEVNRHVTSVDLSFNSIGDEGAEAFARLFEVNGVLEIVNLSECAIGDRGGVAIAMALERNSTLTELDLEANCIGPVTGQAFLNTLRINNFLSSLNVDRTRIGDAMGNEIRIACAINTQPMSLKALLPRLRAQLAIEAGELTEEQAGGPVEPVVELDLSVFDGHRRYDDRSVAILCSELRGCSTLKKLNLADNEFGPDGVGSLADLLLQPTCQLQELDLSSNKIGKHGAFALADAISKTNTLVLINLQQTKIGTDGVMALARALDTNESVQMIQVSKTPDISAPAVAELTRQIAINSQSPLLKRVLPPIVANDPSVTTVALGGSEGAPIFGDTSANLLALALSKNSHVTEIDLSQNDITSEGVEYFADMLEDNSSVTSLNLAFNRIDDRGAQELLRVLRSNDTLIRLGLEGNPISAATAAELDYLLKVNNGPLQLKRVMDDVAADSPALTELDFHGTPDRPRFNDDAVHILCSLLVGNTHVKSLLLHDNIISDIGASLIADMLRVNKSVEKITLHNNRFGEDGGRALFMALKVNHTLHYLSFEGNGVPPDVAEQLNSALIINKQPLRQPKRAKGEYKARPKPEELGDDEQFRDPDYMHDCEDQIFHDGMDEFHHPKRRVDWKTEPTDEALRESAPSPKKIA